MAHQQDVKEPNLICLLIEDDEDHAELILRSAENSACFDQVIWYASAESGIAALDAAVAADQGQEIGAILLDLRFPGKSGFSFIKEVRERLGLLIPIIVLTNSDSEFDIQEAYKLGVNAYLVKPIGADEFRRVVIDCCRFWGLWSCAPKQRRT